MVKSQQKSITRLKECETCESKRKEDMMYAGVHNTKLFFPLVNEPVVKMLVETKALGVPLDNI